MLDSMQPAAGHNARATCLYTLAPWSISRIFRSESVSRSLERHCTSLVYPPPQVAVSGDCCSIKFSTEGSTTDWEPAGRHVGCPRCKWVVRDAKNLCCFDARGRYANRRADMQGGQPHMQKQNCIWESRACRAFTKTDLNVLLLHSPHTVLPWLLFEVGSPRYRTVCISGDHLCMSAVYYFTISLHAQYTQYWRGRRLPTRDKNKRSGSHTCMSAFHFFPILDLIPKTALPWTIFGVGREI